MTERWAICSAARDYSWLLVGDIDVHTYAGADPSAVRLACGDIYTDLERCRSGTGGNKGATVALCLTTTCITAQHLVNGQPSRGRNSIGENFYGGRRGVVCYGDVPRYS